MAGISGNTQPLVMAALERDPRQFSYCNFFAVVRLLQALSPTLGRVGRSRLPDQDPVRFSQKPYLDFPASSIESVQLGPVPKLNVKCFGLFGPNGALPVTYTEYALRPRDPSEVDERAAQAGKEDWPSSARVSSFAQFCDLFHHRMISLFYRAWECNQKAASLDRAEFDRFAFYLSSLIGMGFNSLLDHDSVPDAAKRFYSGHLAAQTRNADGLRSLLEEFFGIPTTIEAFCGRWVDLPPCNVSQMGDIESVLGVNTFMGSQLWDCQMNFRVRMGPMKLAELEHLLPGGEPFQKLRAWIYNYVGEEFFWDVQLVLDNDEVPLTCLGELTDQERDALDKREGASRRPLPQTSLLSWTTWLGSDPFATDADDLVVNPDEL